MELLTNLFSGTKGNVSSAVTTGASVGNAVGLDPQGPTVSQASDHNVAFKLSGSGLKSSRVQ